MILGLAWWVWLLILAGVALLVVAKMVLGKRFLQKMQERQAKRDSNAEGQLDD